MAIFAFIRGKVLGRTGRTWQNGSTIGHELTHVPRSWKKKRERRIEMLQQPGFLNSNPVKPVPFYFLFASKHNGESHLFWGGGFPNPRSGSSLAWKPNIKHWNVRYGGSGLRFSVSSRELTYHTLGKGKSSTQKWSLMGYVSSQEGNSLHHIR